MNYLVLLIACLLTLATVFVGFQVRQNPSPERLKNRQRIIAWWMILSVCVFCFYLGVTGITVLSLGLMLWAGIELSSLFHLVKKTNFFVLALVSLILAIAVFWRPHDSQILLFFCLVLGGVAYFLPIKSKLFLPSFFLFYTIALVSIVLIAVLAESAGLDYRFLLLVLFFVVAVNDIAQYIAGSLYGKTIIAPVLSPKKTLEGVLGGVVITASLCGLLLPMILVISLGEAIAVGCVISIAGLVGDLNISKVKRALKVKDSGRSITGHGGLFDRIDSLLVVAPVFGLIMFLGDFYVV